MAELGAISGDEALLPEKQIWFALGAALCLHVFFGALAQLNYRTVRPLQVNETIDVRLIPSAPIETPNAERVPLAPAVSLETKPIAKTAPLPDPIVESTSEPMAAPQAKPIPPSATSTPPPILNSESGTTRGAFPAQDDGKDYVPSQWALEPPLSDKNLKGIGLLKDAECLRALSEDCASLRKEVFAEYELTEMEKVWTEQRADTGMPSQFYGLSEREIRLKIGSKIAGENGFMILPGIGIDGSLWDMLHGVKKTCQMKRGINSEGRYDVVRICPESLPAARDRKYYIPPKE
jgi:hypothetical protein